MAYIEKTATYTSVANTPSSTIVAELTSIITGLDECFTISTNTTETKTIKCSFIDGLEIYFYASSSTQLHIGVNKLDLTSGVIITNSASTVSSPISVNSANNWNIKFVKIDNDVVVLQFIGMTNYSPFAILSRTGHSYASGDVGGIAIACAANSIQSRLIDDTSNYESSQDIIFGYAENSHRATLVSLGTKVLPSKEKSIAVPLLVRDRINKSFFGYMHSPMFLCEIISNGAVQSFDLGSKVKIGGHTFISLGSTLLVQLD